MAKKTNQPTSESQTGHELPEEKKPQSSLSETFDEAAEEKKPQSNKSQTGDKVVDDLINSYEKQKGDENCVLSVIEKKAFDQATGKRRSKPYVQKFSVKEFKTKQKTLQQLGYTVHVFQKPQK